MALGRFGRRRGGRETPITIGDDPRLDGWETVSMFADRDTALAWRDQLRALGVDAACTADRLDRSGRGDIFLVVPPDQWSRATEIVENVND